MILNVKYNSSHPLRVEVLPTWDVTTLKKEISRQYNIPLDEIKIIFQGRVLPNHVHLKDFDFGNRTVIHAVKGSIKVLDGSAPAPRAAEPEVEVSLDQKAEAYKDMYYVYCKDCKKPQRGRIRVRCQTCKEGAFTLDRDPACWKDVLERGRIKGACHTEGCEGNLAEFYFKCNFEKHSAEYQGSSVPLHHLRPNKREVPCVVCEEVSTPVLVYPCEDEHVICIDCFTDYCTVKINDRNFVQSDEYGYTLPCAGCESGMIEEPHHFRLMGDDQYDRFQRFGTEEFILQNGGVLCPARNCGAGLLPEHNDRKIKCEGCGFTFCRMCKEEYHSGICSKQDPAIVLSPTRTQIGHNQLQRARWENEQCREKIQETTKNCPKCNVPIEKNEGCMHMTCARCRFNFCWLCLIEWNGQCRSRHWFGER